MSERSRTAHRSVTERSGWHGKRATAVPAPVPSHTRKHHHKLYDLMSYELPPSLVVFSFEMQEDPCVRRCCRSRIISPRASRVRVCTGVCAVRGGSI